MEKKANEITFFPLEMFKNSPIKPLLDIPSGYCRVGGAICQDGRGMLILKISDNYAEPLTCPEEPKDQVKEVLMMLIPTEERAECLIEALHNIKVAMRECRVRRDNGNATQDTDECRVSEDNAEA